MTVDAARPTRRYRRLIRYVLLLTVVMVGLLLLVDRYEGLLGNASAARLEQIGAAIDRYAQNHGGTYPASLAELERDQRLDPHLLVCPETHLWASDAASTFIYVGRHLSTRTAGPGTVVAYDPPGYVGGDGVDVLFGDGHTDWVTAAALPAVLGRGGPATAPATRATIAGRVRVKSGHE